MAEEEPGSSTGEEHDEEEAPAAAAAADPKQDDVKPVIFIGLFIATLFTMGIVHCLWSIQYDFSLPGGLELLLNQEENGCAMTYMFEYPQYVPIKMDDQVDH